ncbi:CapA family protein [Caballeronia sp. 15711]|uniref:CapA family protein n=1 Tax=Caballeronia sp. 15711 TaxID=3391029 RepID=UPI0039E33C75
MASNMWDIVLAGECMASRPFSQCEDAEFLKVIDLMRDSDLTMAHLEMNFGDPEEIQYPSRNDWVASFMIADSNVADDFQWAGVDMMSLAHNHSFDWGPDGIFSTIKHCNRVGITHAGTGRDLEEARKPAYHETRKGRAALISVATGNKNNEWAGMPKATMKGRPGMNPLRVQLNHQVDSAAAEQLRRIVEKLHIGYHRFDAVDGEIRLQFPELASNRSVPVFTEGPDFRITSKCHDKDLEANLRSVREAASMADMVLVSHHTATAEGARGDRPPAYAVEFAKACIDAGADMYIGHGWHRTLGIEIYKGKPIFYGLGNFFAQSEFNDRVPADSYESWGHDPDRMPEHNPAAEPLHPGLVDTLWWGTVLFRVKMEGHKVTQIQLYPVNLGRNPAVKGEITRSVGSGSHAKTDGRPYMADPEAGAVILNRMKTLSEVLGTRLSIEDNVGIINL